MLREQIELARREIESWPNGVRAALGIEPRAAVETSDSPSGKPVDDLELAILYDVAKRASDDVYNLVRRLVKYGTLKDPPTVFDLPANEASAHPDDVAVDRFAAAMKTKLAKKRDEGYSGWDDPEECGMSFLLERLRHHVEKGDPVDIANFAMMVWHRSCL